MTPEEIVTQLQELGQQAYKNVLLKHGIPEPLYGVKIEYLQKIRKQIKKDGYELALKLYDTGIYDAMYLAGLVTEPQKMQASDLQQWVEQATAPALLEYTVAWVAAESKFGMVKAMEWIASPNEGIASAGWATLSNIVSITRDEDLDIPLFAKLLLQLPTTIHDSPNRVKLAMNGYIIAVGAYVIALHEQAKQTAQIIGKVTADMGDTACKIPDALTYIGKVESKNGIGKKKKSARCL